ncbi:MAG: C39 family peptidase [Clostridia bacterium]|nr:C39 family peptidase [Clostridia bacterium]
MKKLFVKRMLVIFVSTVVLCLCFAGTGIGTGIDKATQYDDLAQNYFSVMKDVKSEWNDSSLSAPVKLFVENANAYMYRVFKGNEQAGYFVVTDINEEITVSESTFTGEDPLTANASKNYYIAPFGFYSQNEYAIIKDSGIDIQSSTGLSSEASATTINTQLLINVPYSYGYTMSSSYYSEVKVLNTPEYFNYDYGPIPDGCAPTSGAMLVSFYDNAVLSNLSSVTLPMKHSTNKPVVDNLIISLASYMGTNQNGISGTTNINAKTGIQSYFSSKGYVTCFASISTSYPEYSTVILSRNPVMLIINNNPGYHMVLGIGFSNVRYVGTMLITRYNWTSRTGEYQVNASLFNQFIYMSKI